MYSVFSTKGFLLWVFSGYFLLWVFSTMYRVFSTMYSHYYLTFWQELFSAVDGGGAYLTVDNGTPTKIKPSAVEHMTNACIVSGQEKFDFFYLFFHDEGSTVSDLGSNRDPASVD
jgi:hypothetical protein